MSKKMKSAYVVLNAKDMFEFFAWCLRMPTIILAALTLLACNTSAFGLLKVITSVVGMAWAAMVACSALCNIRMGRLGYSEIELERCRA